MLKNIFVLVLSFVVLSLNAQDVLWTQNVSKDAYMSQLDNGSIFLKDKTKIALIDHKTGEVKWENNIATKDDPLFLDNLPIMYFEGNTYAVIDATTGQIIDEARGNTEILNISYFWSLGRVILEMERGGSLYLLNVNLNELSQSWSTNVRPVKTDMWGLTNQPIVTKPSITKNGSVVLFDDKFISIIDKDGNLKKHNEYFNKIEKLGFNREKNMLYMIEDEKFLQYIDINDGRTVATIKIGNGDSMLKVHGDGSTISVVDKKDLIFLDGVTGKEINRKQFDKKINQTYIDPQSGKFYVLTKKKISEVDYPTGKILRATEFDKDYKSIYRVYNKTFVDANGAVNPIDLATLKLGYAKPAKIPPVQDYVVFNKSTIAYTNQSENRFSLNVVNAQGKVIWDKSITSAFPPSLDVINDGVLIVSGAYVDYLSVKDGKSLWNQKVPVKAYFTWNVDKETQDLYMYADKRLHKFDYTTGALTRFEEKLMLKDFDYGTQKPQLLVLSDGIFLKGSNTIYVLSKDGKIKHQKTYKRISSGSSFLNIANIVVTAGVIGTGNVGEILTVYHDDQMVHKGGLVDPLSDSARYADRMADARRAKQNRSSNAFPYVFTKIDKDQRGLIFINPSTGEERFVVPMSVKSPKYIVDDIDGILFHLDNTELKAYDVN